MSKPLTEAQAYLKAMKYWENKAKKLEAENRRLKNLISFQSLMREKEEDIENHE